ncbi:hypothetical protein GCM10027403_07570 [Arthrobacter tecti]
MKGATARQKTGTSRKELLRIALPLIGSGLVTMFVASNDAVLLGGFSAMTVAAAVVSSSIFGVAILFISGMGIPTQVLVARHLGAGEEREAVAAASAGFAVALWIAVPLGALLALSAPLATQWLGGSSADTELASLLLRITSCALPLAAASAVLRGFASGSGTTRVVLAASLASAAVDVVASILLSQWIGPHGVAVGTYLGLATGTSVLLGWNSARRLRNEAAVRVRAVVVRAGALHRTVLQLGWPEAVLGACSAGAAVVVTFLLSESGGAALSAVRYLELGTGYVWVILVGLGSAATTLMARSLGAEDLPAMRCALRNSIQLCLGTAVLLLVIGGLCLPLLMHSIAPPETARLANAYVWLAFAQAVPMALVVCNNSVLRSFKDTRTPLRASLTAEYAVFLPLGWLLTRVWDLSLTGIFVSHLVFWSVFLTIGLASTRKHLLTARGAVPAPLP